MLTSSFSISVKGHHLMVALVGSTTARIAQLQRALCRSGLLQIKNAWRT